MHSDGKKVYFCSAKSTIKVPSVDFTEALWSCLSVNSCLINSNITSYISCRDELRKAVESVDVVLVHFYRHLHNFFLDLLAGLYVKELTWWKFKKTTTFGWISSMSGVLLWCQTRELYLRNIFKLFKISNLWCWNYSCCDVTLGDQIGCARLSPPLHSCYTEGVQSCTENTACADWVCIVTRWWARQDVRSVL